MPQEPGQEELDDKISRMLRSPEGELLMDRVRERHIRVSKDLENCPDLLEVGRCQGKLAVLKWLLSLGEIA